MKIINLNQIVDKGLNYGRHHVKKFTANVPDQSVVVDLGAGKGDDLLIVKSNNSTVELVAIECYAPYQKKLEEKNIRVHNANIEKDSLPFADQSVDIIICNQILEHCKEIWWIAHEISRVLKIGGVLIVGVPNLASLHNRILLMLGRQPTSIQNNTAHVRGYTKNDFVKFLNSGFQNGYSVRGFGGANFYPFPPFLAKPLARLFPTMAVVMLLKFVKEKEYKGGFLTFPIEQQLETNFYLGPAKL